MVITLAAAAPLLVLLSLPDFAATYRSASTPHVVAALCLALLLIGAVPVSLVRRGMPAYKWVRLPALLFVSLTALEYLHRTAPSPADTTPWPTDLACIAFGCLAIGMRRPRHAGTACGVIIAALIYTHLQRVPAGHIVVETIGLALLSTALIVAVRVLRSRADRADAAERQTRELFEISRRRLAIETERARTDSLLHDSVLAALLAAAAGYDSEDRTVLMARSSLDTISDTTDRPDADTRTRIVRFDCAITAANPELASTRGLVRLDLEGARDIELPSPVADAIISAMIQAIDNSIKHAGSATVRTATASPTADGGLQINISDNGCGFDMTRIAPHQLGIRGSILERMRRVGAVADVQSALGDGTTVFLEWHPGDGASPADPPGGNEVVSLITRQALYGTLTALIMVAIVVAVVGAAVIYQAPGPLIAAPLGLALLPSLVRGARSGHMRTTSAWIVTTLGCIACSTATIGLEADEADVVSISWLTCGVLANAAMLWMARQRLPPLVAVACLVATVTIWAGPTAIVRLGLGAEIVLLVATLMLHRALRLVAEITLAAAAKQRETLLWRAELDAFHLERQDRLSLVERIAAPMLRHIIDQHGALDPAARAECRVLEQTLRDEIRGRRLLNDAVRSAIRTHRRRGAQIQVLDDGGLDDLAPRALDALLAEVARSLDPLRSSRIVIRTGQPDTATAVTIVASSPDETAAALGLEADDEVELWAAIPYPTATSKPPA